MINPVQQAKKSTWRSQRGETLLSVIITVLVIGIGWFIFFSVKGWIKDTKDRRDKQGEYAYESIELEVEGKHELAGYQVTFYP
jgi:hypothetical protein